MATHTTCDRCGTRIPEPVTLANQYQVGEGTYDLCKDCIEGSKKLDKLYMLQDTDLNNLLRDRS